VQPTWAPGLKLTALVSPVGPHGVRRQPTAEVLEVPTEVDLVERLVAWQESVPKAFAQQS
jgi:hypothetical protein